MNIKQTVYKQQKPQKHNKTNIRYKKNPKTNTQQNNITHTINTKTITQTASNKISKTKQIKIRQ